MPVGNVHLYVSHLFEPRNLLHLPRPKSQFIQILIFICPDYDLLCCFSLLVCNLNKRPRPETSCIKSWTAFCLFLPLHNRTLRWSPPPRKQQHHTPGSYSVAFCKQRASCQRLPMLLNPQYISVLAVCVPLQICWKQEFLGPPSCVTPQQSTPPNRLLPSPAVKFSQARPSRAMR